MRTLYQYQIQELEFNNGLKLKPGNLTVLVGPNNGGKSRMLKDIQELITGRNPKAIVVREIHHLLPPSISEMVSSCGMKVYRDNNGNLFLRTLAANMTESFSVVLTPNWEHDYEHWIGQASREFFYHFGNYFVSYLDTESRLQITKEGSSGDTQNEVASLLQACYAEGKTSEDRLRAVFRSAFLSDIKLDYSSLSKLVLRVGQGFDGVPADPRDARPMMETHPRLDDQGDGMRSFAATALALLVGKRSVLLIDEPEAFLHPPQAMKLGELIAEHSTGSRQVFVATHSSDVLRGILVKTQDISVLRIERAGNINRVSLLDPVKVKSLATDPILSSSRVLEGLFYSGVVAVEADSDAAFYQRISREVRDTDDVHYVHAHNKQTIPKVLAPYRDLEVRHAAIVDFDILRVKDEFKALLVATGFSEMDVAKALELRERIALEIEAATATDLLEGLEQEVQSVMYHIRTNASQGSAETLLTEARKSLKRIAEEHSVWSKYKEQGFLALSSERQADFHSLDALCSAKGIFIVPAGELESWLVEYGLPRRANKSRWITAALALLPSLEPEIGKAPWSFVAGVHSYLS